MATQKPKNPELAAAANSLADAVHHIGQAFVQKVDEIGASASAELDRAKHVALTKRGQATRELDALLKRAEGKLKKAINEATKSLHKTVRAGEKKLQPAKKVAAKKVAAKKVSAKKVAAKKVAAKRRR
jgi:hypothetical protein